MKWVRWIILHLVLIAFVLYKLWYYKGILPIIIVIAFLFERKKKYDILEKQDLP